MYCSASATLAMKSAWRIVAGALAEAEAEH
jgi:hypothetical protein